jgi:hypothetical protein
MYVHIVVKLSIHRKCQNVITVETYECKQADLGHLGHTYTYTQSIIMYLHSIFTVSCDTVLHIHTYILFTYLVSWKKQIIA